MALSLNFISCSRSSHILVCFMSGLWLSCDFFPYKFQSPFFFCTEKEKYVPFIHLWHEMHYILILEYMLLGAHWHTSNGDRLVSVLPHLDIVLHWTPGFCCVLVSSVFIFLDFCPCFAGMHQYIFTRNSCFLI